MRKGGNKNTAVLLSLILAFSLLFTHNVQANYCPAKVDVIFVIDVTGSMGGEILAVQAAAATIVDAIESFANDFRVGIIAFRDHTDLTLFEDYAFSADKATIIYNINLLSTSGGGDTPEAVFCALLRAIDSSSIGGWRNGAAKLLILMGDAPPHDPDPGPIYGFTLLDVVDAAYLADPAHVYGVCIGYDDSAIDYYTAISEETGGEVFFAATAGDVVEALQEALRTAILDTCPEPLPVIVLPPPDINKMMYPLALENVRKAESLILACQEAIENAPPDKDITRCEELLEQAKEALEKARMCSAGENYIAANFWAIRAIELLKECIECAEDP